MAQIYSGKNPETLVRTRGPRTPGAPTVRKRLGAPTSDAARSARSLTDALVTEASARVNFAACLVGLPSEQLEALSDVVRAARERREQREREQAEEDGSPVG